MDTPLIKSGTVKICSLREVKQAEYVVAAGADLFGLIFAESRRQVDPQIASAIVAESRSLAGEASLRSVGVFVDQDVDQINRTADIVGLDFVQLHGYELPEFATLIERPVIRAFRTQTGLISQEIDGYLAASPVNRIVAALVDGFHADRPGGSGTAADWDVAVEAATRHPVILAGGLTPETVAAGIRAVRPIGVDVSSGVEVDGLKDRELVLRFVTAARRAFSELPQSVTSI
jgi:phosphoribosylanthranilate isomerase